VHVDIVLVGKHEFDLAEHVVGSRWLIDVEAADIDAVPVDDGRIDLLAGIFDAEVMALEHRGVETAAAEPGSLLANIGPDLLDLDRGRHVPERTEYNLLHLVGEDWSLLVGLADHDARRVNGPPVLDHAEHEFRDVDVDVIRPEVMREPAPALHVDEDGSDLGRACLMRLSGCLSVQEAARAEADRAVA